MVETITPVVHGNRRSYRLAVALHVLGATVSAGLLGGALGGLGALLGAPWRLGAVVIVGLAALYALRELARLPIPLPQARRQVPEWWRQFFSPVVASLLYGLGLGVGFATHLGFGTFAVVGAGAFLSGDPALGAVLCAPFGLARGLAALLSRSANDADQAAQVVDRLLHIAAGRVPRLANGGMLLMLMIAALLTL